MKPEFKELPRTATTLATFLAVNTRSETNGNNSDSKTHQTLTTIERQAVVVARESLSSKIATANINTNTYQTSNVTQTKQSPKIDTNDTKNKSNTQDSTTTTPNDTSNASNTSSKVVTNPSDNHTILDACICKCCNYIEINLCFLIAFIGIIIVALFVSFLAVIYGIGQLYSISLTNFWCESNDYTIDEIHEINRQNNNEKGSYYSCLKKDGIVDYEKLFATNPSDAYKSSFDASNPSHVIFAIFYFISASIMCIFVIQTIYSFFKRLRKQYSKLKQIATQSSKLNIHNLTKRASSRLKENASGENGCCPCQRIVCFYCIFSSFVFFNLMFF